MAATVVNGQQPPPDKDHAAIAAQPRPATGSRSGASRAAGDRAVGGRATGAARAAGASGNAKKSDAVKGDVASAGGSGRRSEAARLAVLNATDDLLVEVGFEGLTIEGIAAAAGVAKQTIYRWWKSKVDILFDNLVLDAATGLAWPAGTPADPADLRAYIHRFADFLGAAPAGKVLQALLGHAQLDSRTAELLHGGFLDALRTRDIAHTRACLGGATDKHPTDKDAADEAAVLLDALLAPLYHRAMVLRRPLDPAFVDALLDQHLPDQHLPG
ncbi:TetR/AcrR family transcriptional regulator [Kitasatospora purpeofusca]|uniref:TetR/AcrR family transcriptional regulator n=1 Tax=Kitasatospora purpeofusca TaxID=67352 RepID=UPI003867DF08|nr:TetR/AcrR family transcriptional regulator [Kitasatospora purpeofusca]